jgi:hypothetical protein
VNFEINSVLPSLLLVFVEKVLTCLFTPPLGNFHLANPGDMGYMTCGYRVQPLQSVKLVY